MLFESFEIKSAPLLPFAAFRWRVAHHLLLVVSVTAASLGVGVAGYHSLEQQPFLDALLNASMILGGMGPVDTLHTPEGKWFASAYALYSCFFQMICGGLLLAPMFHRILHHFNQQG